MYCDCNTEYKFLSRTRSLHAWLINIFFLRIRVANVKISKLSNTNVRSVWHGKHFPKVSSKLDVAIMSKLQIELGALKFVRMYCCFTISELVVSNQLIPDNHKSIFWTNLFRPIKFWTNLSPNQYHLVLQFKKIRKLTVFNDNMVQSSMFNGNFKLSICVFKGFPVYYQLYWPS